MQVEFEDQEVPYKCCGVC